jgi:aspartate ammonia-lyase
LSLFIGHLKASKIAQQALKEGQSVKELVSEKSLLKPEEMKRIFSLAYRLGIDRTRPEKLGKKKKG